MKWTSGVVCCCVTGRCLIDLPQQNLIQNPPYDWAWGGMAAARLLLEVSAKDLVLSQAVDHVFDRARWPPEGKWCHMRLLQRLGLRTGADHN